MSAKLDKPIHARGKTDPVIWKTIEKLGVKYTLQVQIDTRLLEGEIAEEIENCSGHANFELLTGNLIVNITRAS